MISCFCDAVNVIPPAKEDPTSALEKMVVDYSLYLVTDSTPAILGDRSLTNVVEQAIKGG